MQSERKLRKVDALFSVFDSPFIRKFAPRRFNNFAFVPSIGASGGILVAWNSSHFAGQVNVSR
jgi:hypothetical protein